MVAVRVLVPGPVLKHGHRGLDTEGHEMNTVALFRDADGEQRIAIQVEDDGYLEVTGLATPPTLEELREAQAELQRQEREREREFRPIRMAARFFRHLEARGMITHLEFVDVSD